MVYEENEFQNRKTVSVPTGDSGGFQRWLDLPARARSSGGATTRAIAVPSYRERITHTAPPPPPPPRLWACHRIRFVDLKPMVLQEQ
ncbi:hypothetical protein LOK49_Contig118G00001 [Camellia lanceoleosa]|nr:hypothetical protein LOK49_Contig118G00001 [Camellia lanceoleosa]